MNSADVFEQIEKMAELPSLPQTLLHVQSVAADETSSAEDLAGCILKDQALTLRILKVVNSAMYQRRESDPVRTVRKAVIVMGFETVRKLALGLSVFDMMSKLSRSPGLVQIANHSLLTATFARLLAEASGADDPEGAFVAGLVHDIGKVVLIECSPEAMERVREDMCNGLTSLEAERRHFGITHDRAGRRLAARWDLPLPIQNAIGDHHDIDPMRPPRRIDPLLGIIVYANALCRFHGNPESRDHELLVLRRACRKLNIPSARLDEIYEQVQQVTEELAASFGLEIGDLHEYSQLVNVRGSVTVAPHRMTAEELARRTAAQLELYRDIGAGLAGGENPEELLSRILEGAVEILGFERVVLLDVDRTHRRLAWHSAAGLEAEKLRRQLELPLHRDGGALTLAVLEHRAIHVPNAANPAYGELVDSDWLREAGCTGFVVSPVRTGGGLDAVLYADGGPNGMDVTAEQAAELGGLSVQAGLVLAFLAELPTG